MYELDNCPEEDVLALVLTLAFILVCQLDDSSGTFFGDHMEAVVFPPLVDVEDKYTYTEYTCTDRCIDCYSSNAQALVDIMNAECHPYYQLADPAIFLHEKLD